MKSKLKVSILTISDRSSRGDRPDLGGPALAMEVLRQGWAVAVQEILPDDENAISERLKSWCDQSQRPDLILTTGGTGLSPRDRTPEATRSILDMEIPGFSERMRREGEKATPMAVLSRAVCGSRKETLILNLPGNPKGACESFNVLASLIPHALQTLKGDGHHEAKR